MLVHHILHVPCLKKRPKKMQALTNGGCFINLTKNICQCLGGGGKSDFFLSNGVDEG